MSQFNVATSLPTSMVNSVTGTTNQVTASPTTGNVVVSTPSVFIGPGSVASTTTNTAGTNFLFPATTSTAGQILQDGVTVFHTFGMDDLFIGPNSGNFTHDIGATGNLGIGASTLASLTTADASTCVGFQCGLNIQDGSNNTFYGWGCGADTTSGARNTSSGTGSMFSNQTGNENAAFGYNTLASVTGSGNTAYGYASGFFLAGGNFNVLVGHNAGSGYTSTESNNIVIGTAGTTAESNVIRIGDNGTHLATYVQGISGVTVTGSAVLCAADGQLGTVASTRKVKHDIQPMADSSAYIYNLEPVTFRYNATPDVKSYGLIAEEVQAVMPDLVLYDNQGAPASVKYHELPAMLLNELIKLQQRVFALESIH